jgi:uncharacterized protein YjbI with pentapeptide repeats
MAYANPDIAALEAQWWKAWRGADFSWDGLGRQSSQACRDIGVATLQDYWAGERDRLIAEPGTPRRWTRFHCPLAFADGSPSPKAAWGEADWRALADDLARLMLDDCVLFAGIVAAFPAITRPNLWLNAPFAYVVGPLKLGAGVIHGFDQAWICGPVTASGPITSLHADDAVFAGAVGLGEMTIGALSLQRALVIGDADLTRTRFTGASVLTGARFAGRVDFSEAIFSAHAQFEQARFGRTVDFFGAHFLNRALFDKAQFLSDLGFYKTAFVRRLSIDDAHFYGKVNLEGATDGDPIVQSSQAIHLVPTVGDGPPELIGTLEPPGGPSVNSFRSLPKLLAHRALFFESANFSNRDLLSPSSFRGAQFNERAQFFGSDVHASVNFHGTEFRKALRYNPRQLPKYPEALLRLRYMNEVCGDYAAWKKAFRVDRLTRRTQDFTADAYFDGLETSFRTLKQMMEDRRDRVREGEFFNYELRARRRRNDVPWWERAASFIYWGISDYGNSIFRPLLVMLALYVGLSLVYFAMGDHWGDHERLFTAGARIVPAHLYSAFGFSWSNVFSPFSVLDPGRFSGGDPWAHDLVFSPDQGFDFRVKVIATVQSLVTLALAFLAGLAARRRFQIN